MERSQSCDIGGVACEVTGITDVDIKIVQFKEVNIVHIFTLRKKVIY